MDPRRSGSRLFGDRDRRSAGTGGDGRRHRPRGSRLDQLTVRAVGGQRRRGFTLRRSQYGRPRALVESARRTGPHETGCYADVNHYISTVTLAGHAVRWQQRNVPRADRQFVDLLDRLLDRRTAD